MLEQLHIFFAQAPGAFIHFSDKLSICEHPDIHAANIDDIKYINAAIGNKNIIHNTNIINQYIAPIIPCAPDPPIIVLN